MPSLIPGPNQDVLPAADDALNAFATSFSTRWALSPFLALPPNAGVLDDARSDFDDKLTVATAPATRTTPNIAAKDLARAALEPLLRQAIRNATTGYLAGTVPAIALNELGVRTPKATRTPIGAPTDAPLMSVDSVRQDQVVLRLTQLVAGVPVTARAFPAGVSAIELWAKVGAGTYAFRQTLRRVNILADTAFAANGDLVTWRARYISPRGEPGPFSGDTTSPIWRT